LEFFELVYGEWFHERAPPSAILENKYLMILISAIDPNTNP